MISFIKALFYLLIHPFEPVHFTIVRRYVDAQGNYIGELYEGEGRSAKMIGMSCDSLAFGSSSAKSGNLRWGESFLAPMPDNVIRVGGSVPSDNESVHEFVAIRRWCPIRITILNRFVERVMEKDPNTIIG